MSADYVSKEVGKIMKDTQLEYPLNVAMSSAWIIGNLKGLSIKVLDVRGMSTLADYFVIASATNPTQARSMADTISKQLRKFRHETNLEGDSDAEWILLDIGDTIIHIFQESSREFFNIDDLWLKAVPVEIPQSYYTSADDDPAVINDKGYF